MTFDRRLTPARADLAAAHLRGKIDAPAYAEGRLLRCCEPVADLRRDPSPQAPIETQVLFGEDVTIYDEDEGYAWVQLKSDSYVGYMSSNALAAPAETPTHRVGVPRTFVYPVPNIKAPILNALPLNARFAAAPEGDFLRLASGGFVFARHAAPLEDATGDFVAVAESLLNAPYLWGGKSGLGVDCSGLVQISLAGAGIAAPRDTDLQEQALGAPIALDFANLRRGDLIFWKGHVGILRDAGTLLHANGFHMQVASEPLREAVERIAEKTFGAVTSVKRLGL
jgi:cell wall-associated NlpC family hydrolase